jgi:hypothetical protein
MKRLYLAFLLGLMAINEVAIASLPGDPRPEIDVDGDGLTLTHYCDGSKR